MMQGFYMLAMRQYRRRRRVLLAALITAAVFSAFAARAFFAPVPVSAGQAVPASYTAWSEGDRLVIYRDGSLLLRTEIDVRSLPEADRSALSKGISLPDAASLASLLEDYGS